MKSIVCDFCRGPEVRWSFPCNQFTAPLADGASYVDDGEWGACDACKSFAELDEIQGLLVRLSLINRLPISRSRVYMLALFFANRTGPPRAVTVKELATW